MSQILSQLTIYACTPRRDLAAITKFNLFAYLVCRAFNALFVLGIHHVQSRMRTLHLRTTKGFLIETISHVLIILHEL